MRLVSVGQTLLQVAEFVEHEQRMLAGAAEVAIVSNAFPFAIGRADAAVHVQHHDVGGTTGMNRVDPLPRQVCQDGEVGLVSCCRLEGSASISVQVGGLASNVDRRHQAG